MLKLRILLSALILAGLAIIGYSRYQAVEADTVSVCSIFYEPAGYNDDGIMVSKVVDKKCYESEAESLRDFSDGAIDLPEDATHQEIEAAIDAYYESQLASDDYARQFTEAPFLSEAPQE